VRCPPAKRRTFLFGPILVSPCALSSPFRIQFSVTAAECLHTQCQNTRLIRPLTATSPLITVAETLVSAIDCTSQVNSGTIIIANNLSNFAFTFQVSSSVGALDCSQNRLAGVIRLVPESPNVAQSWPVSPPLLNLWQPWSELNVSVYGSCSFTLVSWSVATSGSFRFGFYSSTPLTEASSMLTVYPGLPAFIRLVGSVKSSFSGGEAIVSSISSALPPAIYITVHDVGNNTVVSAIAPSIQATLSAMDSAGNTYVFGGNTSSFYCNLDQYAHCSFPGVKAGLKTTGSSFSLQFICGAARLVIGSLVFESAGPPTDTAFSV